MKFYLSVKVDMRKAIEGGTDMCNFRTSATVILKSTDLEEIINQHYDILLKKIDEFVRNGMFSKTNKII